MKKSLLGLTLIELLVTVAVIAIIVLIGVPRFQGVMENNRMIANLNKLSGDLNYARSEAVKRSITVTICGSSNQASCNSTNWEDGWIIFTDQNKDAAINQSDTLLRVAQALPPGLTLRATNLDNLGHAEFLPDGRLRDENNDGTARGTFRLCPQDNNLQHARAVNINGLGRVSVATDTDGNGIVNDVTNTDVACP